MTTTFLQKSLITVGAATAIGLGISAPAQALTFGYADIVLDYFNSGTGSFPGPYGGEYPGGIGYPVPVSTDVVLGDDPNPNVDFLSLPTGSYVVVGFLDELVFDGVGNDIFIQEVGGSGERADIFVSSLLSTNFLDFTYLGTANDGALTSFDLASIGFTDIVKSIWITGLDNGGSSPGFDVVNVQGLPQSITPDPDAVPTPAAVLPVLSGLFAAARRKKNGEVEEA
ncbi:MAG: PTPA-CTERM sorting domain-containing protein [Limnothrix sp. RL_2_0]|nr:PTPA-CTERM sorting domain-containing protein [Limnothrix sp. RL_2_0]